MITTESIIGRDSDGPLTESAEPIAMGLVMKAEHLCKTMRGVRKKGTMTTVKLKGEFLTDSTTRDEFLRKAE
jgi:GTP cyclohydrolase I